MTQKFEKVGIIGAGSWGTALAQTISLTTPDVKILARNDDLAKEINSNHTNERYLGDIELHDSITATIEFQDVAENSEVLFLVTPAQHMRNALKKIKPYLSEDKPLVICSKGIEISSGKLMSDVLREVVPENPYLVLSGPNFAHEVAKGLPAAATLATTANAGIGKKVAHTMFSKTFRPYVTSDPVGAEIGGAVKNVIAIACGIVYGYELGENAKAAIMTRGMAEIKRMGKILGARSETFLGLSGLGDLTLTCNSMSSRNFSLGVARGRGESLNEILAKRHNVTEGVATASAILDFAKKHAVDMPICQAVNDTLHEGVTVQQTVEALLSRPLTQESL